MAPEKASSLFETDASCGGMFFLAMAWMSAQPGSGRMSGIVPRETTSRSEKHRSGDQSGAAEMDCMQKSALRCAPRRGTHPLPASHGQRKPDPQKTA
jgi:cobyrinic acid a,c-diamide synthase